MNINNNYCSKCVLHKGYPGISFNDKNICSMCNDKDITKSREELVMKKKKLFKKYMAFEKHIEKNKTSNYDCMLMLSGGKDSVYMLYSLLRDTKAKILAFTVDLPFESQNAKENIKKVINKLNVEHINFSSKQGSYYFLLENTFKVDNQKLHGLQKQYNFVERLPCLSCALYMRLISFQVAKRMNIPYILYCADPVQMLSMDNDIEVIVKNMVDFTNRDVFQTIFGETVESMLGKSEDRPEIIFPYIKWNEYDANKIIEELKMLELYQSDSFMTHCTLWGILNYFSIKHYGCLFYEYDYADEIRRGMLKRELLLKNMEYLKEIVIEIADEGKLDKEKYIEIYGKTKELLGNEHIDYVLEQIANAKNTAHKIGFDLFDINNIKSL